MQVAVPAFGDRVSPRFDCAVAFLVVTIDQGEIVARHELDASHWAPHERINRLVGLGVDVLLCGGIDRWSSESLRSVGISLVRSVTGPIDENLELFLRGELQQNVVQASGEHCRRFGAGVDTSGESPLGCRPQDAGQRFGRRRKNRGGWDLDAS
jgi:predicted Fe-Mo cluster-binding NifX family protein